MDSNLLKTKSIEQCVSDVEHGGKALKRTLTAFDLTLLGIGAIIGTGIFVLTGTAAANQAGPAIGVSYLAAGLACAFAALCYAEFAAMIRRPEPPGTSMNASNRPYTAPPLRRRCGGPLPVRIAVKEAR